MLLLYRGKSFVSWRIKAITLSRYSHAAWLKASHPLRTAIRQADWTGCVDEHLIRAILDAGCIEAWHKGGVRETDSLTDGHKGGTVIDVYDFFDMPDCVFDLITEDLHELKGCGYWFGGIFAARFNRFFDVEPPMKDGVITDWFCSHAIEDRLRGRSYPTTDRDVPAHGVWPGSLARSVKTKYLFSITLPKNKKPRRSFKKLLAELRVMRADLKYLDHDDGWLKEKMA